MSTTPDDWHLEQLFLFRPSRYYSTPPAARNESVRYVALLRLSPTGQYVLVEARESELKSFPRFQERAALDAGVVVTSPSRHRRAWWLAQLARASRSATWLPGPDWHDPVERAREALAQQAAAC